MRDTPKLDALARLYAAHQSAVRVYGRADDWDTKIADARFDRLDALRALCDKGIATAIERAEFDYLYEEGLNYLSICSDEEPQEIAFTDMKGTPEENSRAFLDALGV